MSQVSFVPTHAFFPAIISGCLLILTCVCVCIYTCLYTQWNEKSEIMPFVATWIYPEIIILSEVREKEKYWVISLICGIYKIKQ